MKKTLITAVAVLVLSVAAASQLAAAPKPAARRAARAAGKSAHAKIADAMRAAPANISRGAMIMDWGATPDAPMTMLRSGTNGWTCMPSSPEVGGGVGADPMCLDKSFMDWAGAWMSKKDPQVSGGGVAYMLRGDKGASNTDPFATGATPTNAWVVSPPHVMVIVSSPAQLEGISADPTNGGPWVMWKVSSSKCVTGV